MWTDPQESFQETQILLKLVFWLKSNSTSEIHFGEKESSLNDEIGFGEKLIVNRIPLLHSRENGWRQIIVTGGQLSDDFSSQKYFLVGQKLFVSSDRRIYTTESEA